MQQVDAREPVSVAIERAAAEPHRRNARHVGAVGEGRAHQVELALYAPHAVEHARDIVLGLEFAAAEDRVALRVDRLIELGRGIAAALESRIAHYAGEPAENEALEARIIGRRLEA